MLVIFWPVEPLLAPIGKHTSTLRTGLRLSFHQLNERVNQLANALVSEGVNPGDRVALCLMNSVEFIESFLAVAKMGGVVVPLNWRLVADELEFIIKDSGAETMIYGSEFHSVVSDLQSRGDKTDVARWIEAGDAASVLSFAQHYDAVRDSASASEPTLGAIGDDLLFIMYTSGTTGLPKGVVHSHATVFWAILTFEASCDLRDGDRYLVALPLFHVGALTPVALNVYRGVTSIVMREFDPCARVEFDRRGSCHDHVTGSCNAQFHGSSAIGANPCGSTAMDTVWRCAGPGEFD